MFNGSSYNTFLISHIKGDVQLLQVSNDIMQNKNDNEYSIFISPKIQILDEKIVFLPFDNMVHFNPLNAEKNREDCNVVTCFSNH